MSFLSSWQEEAAAGREIPGAQEERQAGELPEQEEEEECWKGPQEAAQTAAQQQRPGKLDGMRPNDLPLPAGGAVVCSTEDRDLWCQS